MAQKQTNTLPISVIQPVLPKPPTSIAGVMSWIAQLYKQYLRPQQTMIQTMYNSVVQSQASQNLIGLAADLPKPGTPGRQFVATDTKVIYFDTGSGWLQVQAM